MRIALLGPAWFPVPPQGYGGIEAIVSLLADGLVGAGHEVTLFASGDSRSRAEVQAVFPEAPSSRIGTTDAELLHALTCFERAGEFDVVSDHSGPLAAALGGAAATPVVHTVHGPLDGEAGEIYRKAATTNPRLALVSLSENQRRPAPELPWAGTCHNAIELSDYPVKTEAGDYLLFLGRLSPDKGAHRAAEVAREAGLPLRLAGKCREPAEEAYFAECVEPLLGGDIEWLGEATLDEKVCLLQGARATLFPIEWEEPFGLVMIESMACGTPVIATRRGAVPEVVPDGVGGVVVDDYREMVRALDELDRIDPAACRAWVEERFSPARMVSCYEEIFESVVAGQTDAVAATA